MEQNFNENNFDLSYVKVQSVNKPKKKFNKNKKKL